MWSYPANPTRTPLATGTRVYNLLNRTAYLQRFTRQGNIHFWSPIGIPAFPRPSLFFSVLFFQHASYACTYCYGDRPFAAAAPTLRNNLPYHIRTATSVNSLKKSLKTNSSKTNFSLGAYWLYYVRRCINLLFSWIIIVLSFLLFITIISFTYVIILLVFYYYFYYNY